MWGLAPSVLLATVNFNEGSQGTLEQLPPFSGPGDWREFNE